MKSESVFSSVYNISCVQAKIFLHQRTRRRRRYRTRLRGVSAHAAARRNERNEIAHHGHQNEQSKNEEIKEYNK